MPKFVVPKRSRGERARQSTASTRATTPTDTSRVSQLYTAPRNSPVERLNVQRAVALLYRCRSVAKSLIFDDVPSRVEENGDQRSADEYQSSVRREELVPGRKTHGKSCWIDQYSDQSIDFYLNSF